MKLPSIVVALGISVAYVLVQIGRAYMEMAAHDDVWFYE